MLISYLAGNFNDNFFKITLATIIYILFSNVSYAQDNNTTNNNNEFSIIKVAEAKNLSDGMLALSIFLDNFKFIDYFKISFEPRYEDGTVLLYTTIESIDYEKNIQTKLANIISNLASQAINIPFDHEESICNVKFLHYTSRYPYYDFTSTCSPFSPYGYGKYVDPKYFLILGPDSYDIFTISDEIFSLIKEKFWYFKYTSGPAYDYNILFEAFNGNNEVIASTTHTGKLHNVLLNIDVEEIRFKPGFYATAHSGFTRSVEVVIPFDIDDSLLSSIVDIRFSAYFDEDK